MRSNTQWSNRKKELDSTARLKRDTAIGANEAGIHASFEDRSDHIDVGEFGVGSDLTIMHAATELAQCALRRRNPSAQAR